MIDDYLVVGYANTASATSRVTPFRNGSVETWSLSGSASASRGKFKQMTSGFDARAAARQTLRRLHGRNAGWGPDGDGQPLSARAEALATDILDGLSEEALNASLAIVPNTDGGVQLEWGRDEREVEVLIGPNDDGFDVSVRGDEDRDGFEGRLLDADIRRLENEVRWAEHL